MNIKEKKFIRGLCKSQWKKIEPRDWMFLTPKGREISYGTFGGYVDRSDDKRLKNLLTIISYGKKEDKKQCRKCGYIADYFDNLFY